LEPARRFAIDVPLSCGRPSPYHSALTMPVLRCLGILPPRGTGRYRTSAEWKLRGVGPAAAGERFTWTSVVPPGPATE
jgi:hypothetical protein